LANVDVDSVCTAKIVMELLTIDAIAYSFVPIDGLAGFQKAYLEYAHTVCEYFYIILLLSAYRALFVN
jgi:hypothetical protein